MLAHFGHHLPAPPALLTPLQTFVRDEFNLNKTQLGFLGSAYNLPYGLSQLPAGWLAGLIGPRILTTIGVSGVALCGLLVGLSPTYSMMVVFLILMGVIGGGYHPAASPLVSASVEEKNRGRALGLHQMGGTVSFFLTPLIAAAIAGAIGWRGTFISLSIPTVILGIILYVILGRRGYTSKPKVVTPDSYAESPSTPSRLRHLTSFVVLGAALQILIFSTISFVPVFAVDRLGASKEAAAGLLSLVHFTGLVAGLMGGYLCDRLGKVPVMLAVSVVTGPAIYLLNTVSFGWNLSIVLLLIGTCQYISMPVSEAYIISHTSERNRTTILGVYYFASRGGPGLVMPVLGGLIDKFDFYTSFTMVSATALAVTLICSIFLWVSRD